MLQFVQIENFRCFRELRVNLKHLNVLIGRNDSGKSAFLAALEYMAARSQFTPEDRWRKDQNLRVVLAGRRGQERHAHSTSPETGAGDFSFLMPYGFYRLPAQGIAAQSSGFTDQPEAPGLSSNGDNTAGVLDYFLRMDRKRFYAIRDATKQLVPGLEDINITTPNPQERRLTVDIDQGLRLDFDRSSAGVRLLLFFVTLAYHPVPPRLILLEEPENGIHPKRLGDVVNLLRQIGQGKHGQQAAQVVIATHSPYLLDFINLDSDQVLVFRRNPDGSRTAEEANAERLKVFLDEFKLGEVWFNEGEEGLTRNTP